MNTTRTHEVLTGICACCLGRFVVEGQRPVLHGYKRPGHGSIKGECVGLRFPAYEVSTEGCAAMVEMFKRTAAQATERARALEAGEIKAIAATVRNYRTREVSAVTLTPASTAEEIAATGRSSYGGWAGLVESEIRNARRDAAAAERDAAVYQAKIDGWKPGLSFVSEERLNADKAEARASKQDAAAQKRRFKACKAVFFHLGAAIAKHKRGWLHPEWEWEQIYVKANPGAPNRYASVSRLAPFADMYPAAKGRKGSK